MHLFVAAAYQSPELALTARAEILRLAPHYLDDVGDAIIANTDDNGIIDLDQIVNLWAVSSKGTSLWSLLSGLLFLHPLLGLLERDSANGIVAALGEFGLPSQTVMNLRAMLEPGRAAMLMIIADRSAAAVTAGLERAAHHIMRQPVDLSKAALVQAAFARGRQDARRQRETAYGAGHGVRTSSPE